MDKEIIHDENDAKLEELHERNFSTSTNENLQRVIEMQKERRILKPVIETVVTYGAYEDPI